MAAGIWAVTTQTDGAQPRPAVAFGIFGRRSRDFRQRARRIGIDAIASPIHAPKANAIVERVTGTLRRECLDQIIVLNEQHLMAVLREFVAYYNHERPPRTLALQTPEQTLRRVTGSIQSHPVLNGLQHVYESAA
jgi:putative transposase